MQGQVKRAVATILGMSQVLSALEQLDKQPPNTLRVLAYHRVDRPEHRGHLLTPDLLSATPDEFARQMHFVSRRYQPISADRLVEAIKGNQSLPSRAILITFDDGYRDLAENAWPVLKYEGIPAILFISTAFPGDTSRIFWWDALYQMLTRTDLQEVTVANVGTLKLDSSKARRFAAKRLRNHMTRLEHDEREMCLEQLQYHLGIVPERKDSLLTWDDLRQLAGDGLTIAPHTHSHPILSQLSAEQITCEVQTSRQWIRQRMGQDWPIFCYPNGQSGTFNHDTKRVLEENGYVAAFTMVWGTNVIGQTHSLEMRRLGVSYRDSLSTFRLHLTNEYARYKRLCRRAWRTNRSLEAICTLVFV